MNFHSTSARGRGFAAYLPGCARQLLTVRCAHYAEGASLTTFGFVTTVPRYLPKASNSLTFVRGADRACCAPRKWPWRPTNVRLYQQPHALRRGIGVRTRQRHLAAAALTALVVRRVNGDVALFVRLANGFADRSRPACTGSPHAPPVGALACAPGSGTLPPALVVRRVNSGVALFVRRVKGFADQLMLACASRRTPPRRGIGVRPRQRHLAALAACRQNSQFFPIISASGVDISSFLLHN